MTNLAISKHIVLWIFNVKQYFIYT